METIILIKNLINFIGDRSSRQELIHTPSRVNKTLKNIYYGYIPFSPEMNKSFEVSNLNLELIYIKDVFFGSNCEHHMLPFFGKADFIYYPSTKIIGLSKIISILNYYSARLQTQERLAQQVAYCIKRLIRPRALIIRLTCKHTCMMIRNVKSICSSTSVTINDGISNISEVVMNKMLNSLNN